MGQKVEAKNADIKIEFVTDSSVWISVIEKGKVLVYVLASESPITIQEENNVALE